MTGVFFQVAAYSMWSSLPWLRRLRVPALVLAGSEDPMAPPANARLIAADPAQRRAAHRRARRPPLPVRPGGRGRALDRRLPGAPAGEGLSMSTRPEELRPSTTSSRALSGASSCHARPHAAAHVTGPHPAAGGCGAGSRPDGYRHAGGGARRRKHRDPCRRTLASATDLALQHPLQGVGQGLSGLGDGDDAPCSTTTRSIGARGSEPGWSWASSPPRWRRPTSWPETPRPSSRRSPPAAVPWRWRGQLPQGSRGQPRAALAGRHERVPSSGQDVAATPGWVIHRSEMFELIHFTPTADRVGIDTAPAAPAGGEQVLLLGPRTRPQPDRVRRGRGVDVYTIVWRDPTPEHASWGTDRISRPRSRPSRWPATSPAAHGPHLRRLLRRDVPLDAARSPGGDRAARPSHGTMGVTVVDFGEPGGLGITASDPA